jgi:ATP-dependent helicase HrpB
MTHPDTPLPIDEALPDLLAALASGPNAIVIAPPGAGKTTRVPLALIEQPWVRGRKLIMLEPRRLAARAAAARMAATLAEKVGDMVGLRVRLGSKVSARTRIEVVTEGVFARMILDDPMLDGVAGVIFDEFHERSLDADLGLALALDAQAGLRDDLRIIVMSATLDGGRISGLMGDAPLIRSEGRAFPVETRYLGRDPRARLEDEVATACLGALRSETGSLLVFLPGQGEIMRTHERLRERISDPDVDLAPLHGGLDMAAQDLAVKPAAPGRRKIVLATSIAETSLTIEGVRVVVDSGLARVPVYEPDVGVTRLATVRASRAAVDQRRGRAGRTEAGICLRLWEEAGTGALPAFATPEMLSADLAPLLLDCAAWGETDPRRLRFLDAPPLAALTEAAKLLRDLEAIDADGRITPSGKRLRELPLPPRLARMVLEAARRGAALHGAELAAVLVERGLGGDGCDLGERLERFRRERGGRADDMRRLARGWAERAGSGEANSHEDSAGISPGALLALAYPERIARARGRPGAYLLANGRGAELAPHDRLAKAGWLVVAEMSGNAAASRILSAAALDEDELAIVAASDITEFDETTFEADARALRRRIVRRLGAIILAERTMPVEPSLASAAILARGIGSLGVGRLPWTKAQLAVRGRVAFLRQAEGDAWPDLSDDALAMTTETWLAPHIIGRNSLAVLSADDLGAALDALVPWDMRRRLDSEAPSHFTAPTGNQATVDYGAEAGPTVAIRVQELFGLKAHPSLAGGRVPLVLELLSPAHRPIQITRDLPGFWKGSWAAVKSEMKGRYPRHVWPDDPAGAMPTARAKPRGA